MAMTRKQRIRWAIDIAIVILIGAAFAVIGVVGCTLMVVR